MDRSLGRILVTGASGQLGSYLLKELRCRDLPVVAWSGRPDVELFGYRCRPVDLRHVDDVVSAFDQAKPDVVVHAAAMSSVGQCFRNPDEARQTNSSATRLLAELADRRSARLVYVSTDLVFDGREQWYRETHCPAPLSVYGRSKAAAERAVLDHPRHLVLRVSLLYGPSINGRLSFFDQQLQTLESGLPCTLFEDEWRTPLGLQTAAMGLLCAAGSEVAGILHLGGPERMSRLEMGHRLARLLGRDPKHFSAARRDDVSADEPRPRDTSLHCGLWQQHFANFVRPVFEEELNAMGVKPANS